MNRCLDCMQIWYDYSPGTSDDLINFWDESIKHKWLLQPIKKYHGSSKGHFFHYFLILMDRAYG